MNERIKDVLELYEQLIYHIENEEHGEERLLRKELQAHASLAAIPLSLTECHIIACIGSSDEMINGTLIAKALNITKGGVSKAASKLVAKNIAEVVRSENNKKEVYYQLTELGEKLYNAHEEMHEKAKAQQQQILNAYTDGELVTIAKFLKDFMFNSELD